MSSLADRIRSLRPSCGPVRLVAVDGPAGAGKTWPRSTWRCWWGGREAGATGSMTSYGRCKTTSATAGR
ncbi:hypothetical protein EJK15_04290 [Nonomuraea basaltis]|nr:hypothetical protein EJK15_04290 [Nonomuraea basaltis]